ncbi:putative leucine-rich repeat receptor-like serine/threonine-protein kinase [Acorus calamus]|uniref:Leucine-rich repeat receptor-like serine/threonine-protein kinase n=1 Tax=Acorus calamus TaxID=4465 RepID=A0AAV9DZW8_ACOCL|nr:putative leucine-rich repeat receptor-like serine/threonine-protein kinase [Acorus calamus]KAK1306760.1 putative leucine-rich repeat receptor-like serine/threonine-protein kinase [Acorus calamus]
MRFCCFDVGKSNKKNRDHPTHESGIDFQQTPKNVRLFSYNEMRSATLNFSPMNKIGRGGFGVVYKGVLRDGTEVAVKSLSTESKQGTNEFLTEIDMVSNVIHPNLLRLIGCCVEGANRMLVYEYMENNSLASALLGNTKSDARKIIEFFTSVKWCVVFEHDLSLILGTKSKRIFIDWPLRSAICIGTAQGLAFLHEEAKPHIVHRDIKASNVLLDRDLVPKIGDFGLAKLFPDSVTHISTRVVGTMGYLAPEYALLGQLTKKADIYSFGVLILEIVSGRSSTKAAWGRDMKVLLEWTWSLRDEDRLLEIVDPELANFPEDEVLRFIKVALFCTQAAAQQRPSMIQVVKMLTKGMSLDVSKLTQPGITKDSNQTYNDTGTSSRISQVHGGKKSPNPYSFITSTRNFNSNPIITTQMEPR